LHGKTSGWLNALDFKRMSGAQRQEMQKGQLTASIPFSKWMNGIEIRKELGNDRMKASRSLPERKAADLSLPNRRTISRSINCGRQNKLPPFEVAIVR
jgi:hypothetical protein